MSTVRPVIVLDPDHGGHSPAGGSTPDNVAAPGLSERQLTLDLARCVRERLRSAGTVMLTRDSDTNLSLQNRAVFGQMVNADYFVSLHFNAHLDVAHDSTETYVARAATPGDEELAEALRQSLSAALGTTEGGVFRADLGVLQRTRHLDRTRVALLEACDLSNPSSGGGSVPAGVPRHPDGRDRLRDHTTHRGGAQRHDPSRRCSRCPAVRRPLS